MYVRNGSYKPPNLHPEVSKLSNASMMQSGNGLLGKSKGFGNKKLFKISETFSSHLTRATEKLEGKASTMTEMEKSRKIDQIMAGFRRDLGMKALSNKEKLRRAANS